MSAARPSPDDTAEQRLFLAFSVAMRRFWATRLDDDWRAAETAWFAFHRVYLPGAPIVPLVRQESAA